MNRSVLSVDSTVLALLVTAAVAAALPRPARAGGVTPPPVPQEIQVPAGNEAFLEGHAVGTQDYVCVPSSGGFAWTLFTPQATLFDDRDGQIITHFFSPNPFENGVVRATWQDSRDTSTVWAHLIHVPSTDPDFVAPGAIPWLLLQVGDDETPGAQDGPTGGAALTATTFIQRVNTSGGAAPATGCASARDVGSKAFVPYTADYVFYQAAGAGDRG